MSKYSKDFIASLEKFKRRKLDKYNAGFLVTLRQYAQERPHEFPTFERDLAIGSIVAGRNYVTPPTKRHLVDQLMGNRNFPSFSSDFLWNLELFKTKQLKQYGSGFLSNLRSYIQQGRPWEFVNFQDDPTIGALVSEHFDPIVEVSWVGGLGPKSKPPIEEESEDMEEPVVIVTPDPDALENPFEKTPVKVTVLEAEAPSGNSNILMVLGAAVLAYFCWQYFSEKK